MTRAEAFFRAGDDCCRAYRNIRDLPSSPAIEGRAFVEELWNRYKGLHDPNFLEDAQLHFVERFWEMYLAVTLKERGFAPVKTKGLDALRRCAAHAALGTSPVDPAN